jgi:hypothetical protein
MTAQTILPANSVVDTGYDVANSCRFNDGDSAYMHKTLGTPTDIDKATFSTWIKIGNVQDNQDTVFFGALADGNNASYFQRITGGVLRMIIREGGTYIGVLTTNRALRDPSAWYHIVIAFDTNQGTEANRIKLYINGVQETSFSTATYPTQNVDLRFNTSGQSFNLSRRGDDANYLDGLLAETVFIDGQQLAADQFGEFDDSGIWKPIDVSDLTFGDNGFYLDYEASGNLGNDVNGGTDLTEVNLAATDQSTDTCTNNFATLNPLAVYFNATESTYSEGNLQVATAAASNSDNPSSATIGITSGKWYWETKYVSEADGGDDEDWSFIGMMAQNPTAATGDVFLGGPENQFAYRGYQGKVFRNNTVLATLATYTAGDIISIAYDADNNLIYFYKNGAIQNSGTGLAVAAPASTPLGAWFPAVSTWDARTFVWQLNFGSAPFAISSGNADGNGFGNFEYAVPSGYFALCTKNLAEHG